MPEVEEIDRRGSPVLKLRGVFLHDLLSVSYRLTTEKTRRRSKKVGLGESKALGARPRTAHSGARRKTP
jgi:hypothetical protein